MGLLKLEMQEEDEEYAVIACAYTGRLVTNAKEGERRSRKVCKGYHLYVCQRSTVLHHTAQETKEIAWRQQPTQSLPQP